MNIDDIVRTFCKGYGLYVTKEDEDEKKRTYKLFRQAQDGQQFGLKIYVLKEREARNYIEVVKYLFNSLNKINQMQKEQGIITKQK